MIEVHDNTRTRILSPKLAIVIYGGEQYHLNRDDTAYATVHRLRGSGRKKKLQPGVPIDRESLSRVLHQLSRSDGLQLLPPNVLAVGPDYLAWWVAPTRRGVWFAAESRLGSRQGVVPHPGLVFVAVGQEIYVTALKGNERPKEDSSVFMAPYFNVWKPGRICKGNVPFPNHPSIDAIDRFSSAFFESYSTAPNEQMGLVAYRGGATALWRHLLDGKFECFPEKALVSLGTTLQTYLQETIGRRHARA